ncbi:hypothetical protein [Sphingomonas alpina]|uniref:DUF2846 domain-containing protein n=1 Tax=Sphingomonas alpina TaxID=653931 RepID=A0A7H0LLC5_9SPHN|nr:hypothetical protein [Sphingomonas alpina]QNQ10478.1 hypothetical protein H3Z74_04460 [Sphingomonas alpina]
MKKNIASLMLAVAVAGMAVPAIAQDGAAAATAAIATKSGTIGAPAAGKGMIVFYRPGSLMGAALGCTVREGEGAAEQQIARLGSGKYWVHMAEPGKHAYRTEGEKTDVLNLEIEPDETYFVKCKIGMGIMAGRANISPSDQAEFGKKAKGLKLWEPKADKDDKGAKPVEEKATEEKK